MSNSQDTFLEEADDNQTQSSSIQNGMNDDDLDPSGNQDGAFFVRDGSVVEQEETETVEQSSDNQQVQQQQQVEQTTPDYDLECDTCGHEVSSSDSPFSSQDGCPNCFSGFLQDV